MSLNKKSQEKLEKLRKELEELLKELPGEPPSVSEANPSDMWELIQEIDIHYHNVELKQSMQKYKVLLENSSDITWEVDAEGRYTFIRSESQRYIGI